MRRLPVYILLDCSESMVGEAVDSVQHGLDALLQQLRTDPHALETAWVSIITFSNEAQQIGLLALDQQVCLEGKIAGESFVACDWVIPDQPPVARASHQPSFGHAPLEVTFMPQPMLASVKVVKSPVVVSGPTVASTSNTAFDATKKL